MGARAPAADRPGPDGSCDGGPPGRRSPGECLGRDHLTSIIFSYGLADYYGRIGDLDAGLAVIEGFVTRPGLIQSTTWLRLHPAYDPYRGDPRFNALLARRARFEADGRR